MKIISVKENPEFKDRAIKFIQSQWAERTRVRWWYVKTVLPICVTPSNPLPQWYLLMDGDKIIGCAGIVTNDFISRMDLYPWLCAVYIEEEYRGNAYSSILLENAKIDAKEGGFNHLYLSTDHIGLYEKFGFEFIGTGYHPWGDNSRIYKTTLE